MAIFKNKLVLLVLAGMVLAGVVWYSFMRDDSTQLLQTEDFTAANAVDSDVVGVLLQLRAVTLSGTIFTDPVFQSLQDFGRDLVPEPVGRPNPFAPIGAATVVATSTTQSTTTSTTAPARAGSSR